MKRNEIADGLYEAIILLDADKARNLAEQAIKTGIDVTEAIEMGMSPAMDEVGKKFQSGEIYLPELQLSAIVFQAAMDILQSKIGEAKGKEQLKPRGRILIGTVKGDIHNLGKDMVCTMLKVAGFEVIDLGVDVPPLTFLEEAERNKADIIGLSSLLTTTMPQQREVIEVLISEGIRDKFRVIIGGGASNQEWAREIMADGWGANAAHAVELAKKLCPSGGRKN